MIGGRIRTHIYVTDSDLTKELLRASTTVYKLYYSRSEVYIRVDYGKSRLNA